MDISYQISHYSISQSSQINKTIGHFFFSKTFQDYGLTMAVAACMGSILERSQNPIMDMEGLMGSHSIDEIHRLLMDWGGTETVIGDNS